MSDLWPGWWALRGPSAWCQAIASDVASGRSIILQVPQPPPPTLREAVLHACGDDGADVSRMEEVGATHPVSALSTHLGVSSPGSSSTSLAWIVAHLADRRRLVWVSGIDAAAWPTWLAMLPSWAHATRSLPEYARPVLIIDPPPTVKTPAEDVTLVIRRWSWTAVEADLPAWDRCTNPVLAQTTALGRLASAQRVAIAGWDPELLLALQHQTDPVAFGPILAQVAARRGWTSATTPSWANSILGETGGRDTAHAAWLHVTRQQVHLDRRVWSAQLGVIMPVIEQRRISWVRNYQQQLRLPWLSAYSVVRVPEEVEIGLLAHQVAKGLVRAGTDGAAITLAAGVRNDLAHGRPIAWATAQRLLEHR